MENKQVQNLSIDDVVETAENIRTFITKEYLDELSDSIRKVGILQPLIVIKKENKYEIVAGHRRYLAARQAGLVTVPCIVQEFNSEMTDLAKVHENLFREDISPTDEAKYYKLLMSKYNYALESISGMVSRTIHYIQGRLDILQFPDDVLNALDTNQINLSVAKEFAKITDNDKRGYYLNLAIANGITGETAKQWRFQYEVEKGQRSPQEIQDTTYSGIREPIPLNVVCQGCTKSVDIKDSRVLYLCTGCHDAIQKIIKGG